MATPQYLDLKNDCIAVEEISSREMGTTSIANANASQGYVRQVPMGATIVVAGDRVAYEPPIKSVNIIQGSSAFSIIKISSILFSYTEPPAL